MAQVKLKIRKKTMPSALINMMLLVTVFYFLVQLSYVAVVPSGSEGAPLVEMGNVLMGTIGAIVIVLTAIFSVTGNVTSSIISSSRISFAMAEDGCLPQWFGEIHEKYNTPVNSLVFLGILVLLLAISGTFVYLAVASALIRMLAYAICILALPAIRKKADEETRSAAMTLPGGMLIPGIAMLVSLFAISQSTLSSWAYLGGFFLLGNLLYFFGRKYSQQAAEK